MKREIREKRRNLLITSRELRRIAFDADEKGFELRRKQNEIYNKWLFYDNLIKTCEKKKES